MGNEPAGGAGHQVLMKNMRDYAFTNSRVTNQFAKHGGDVRKVPLVRTAADWALLGDPETKAFVGEFASSEQAFFDAFQAAWDKVQKMTASELQTCKEVPCTYTDGVFRCGI